MQPFNLEGSVNRQQWGWLLDLPDRLNIVIEVVDDRYVPVFSAGSAPVPVAIRQMLTTGEPSLRSAISNVMHSTARRSVAFDAFEAVCFGLQPTGVLVLARELAEGDSAAECHRDLELIGSWLTGAIEANFAKPPGAMSAEPYRIASLGRILSEARSRGSARNVVGAFVEALGVWDHVDVRGYIAGARGGFFHYVSPMGASPSSLPAELGDAIVPRDARMVRLSRATADLLGLPSESDDVLLRRIPTGTDVGWLLVFSGAIDGPEQVRLTVYSDMLRESLNDVIATTTNRLVAAVTRHFSSKEPMEAAARAILGELTAAVSGEEGALVVTTKGRTALSVGNTDLLPEFEPHAPPPDRLVVKSLDGGSLMVVIAREHPEFTALERELVQAGVAVVHSWAREALQRSGEGERRRRFRPVDALFEQLAAEAVQAGQQASMIVISTGATVLPPELLTWLSKIRGQLRSWDFAAILSDNEIAVLLGDASADQAGVVSDRLKQLMEPVRPAIGVMTSSPESPFERSLVEAARAGARAVR